MDSMYGGRPGVSFTLKDRFDSVASMIDAFQQGPNYKQCWYNEFCIIDTPNKNDETNGQIYQRGLDYNGKDANGNPTGGAIYIGQIVGPSSGTPYMAVNTIPEVETQTTIPLDKYEYRRYPTGYKYEDGKVVGYTTSDGSDGAPLAQFNFSEAHDTSLVPGKYTDNQDVVQYNDEIKWTWCNIRKDNEDSDSWFYVGLEIPYLITDYSTHMTSPYDANGNILTDATEISRIDDQTHPFYSHWDLGLPKGVKGDTIRNLRVIVPTEADKIYDVGALSINPDDNSATVNDIEYAGKADDVAAQRQIVVFDYYIYDDVINPTPYTFYIGDFNTITDIKVEDDGTLVISYTHEDDSVFVQKIRWIDQIELTGGNGTQGGHFTFTYNVDVDPDAENPIKETKEFDVSWIKGLEIEQDGSIVYTYAGTPDELPDGAHTAADLTDGKYRVDDFMQWLKNITLDNQTGDFTVTNNRDETIFTTVLDWIRDIIIDPDGTIHFIHTDSSVGNNGDVTVQKVIKYVDSVSLNPTTGQFVMDFNTGDQYTSQLDWIDDIYINEADGEIAIHHTHSINNVDVATDQRPAAEVLPAKLKLVTGAEINAAGVITFITNTGDKISLNNNGTQQNFQLKYIQNITLNTGIEEDKHIFVKYNTESSNIAIGDPINYIEDMVVRTEDWHLLVLFNDPAHRFIPSENQEIIDDTYKDAEGVTWVRNIRGSKGQTYNSRVFWRDYGTIKDQSGVLIGFNLRILDDGQIPQNDNEITKEDIAASEGGTLIGYLNGRFPAGLTGAANQPGGTSNKDKIITVGDPENNKEFYAYDYNLKTWYFLGRLDDSGLRDAKLLIGGTNNDLLDAMENITTNGILLRAGNMPYSATAMPKPWEVPDIVTNGGA